MKFLIHSSKCAAVGVIYTLAAGRNTTAAACRSSISADVSRVLLCAPPAVAAASFQGEDARVLPTLLFMSYKARDMFALARRINLHHAAAQSKSHFQPTTGGAEAH